MRVLVGPRVDLQSPEVVGKLARRIAQDLSRGEDPIISLRAAGVGNLTRRLSAAEVHLLRGVILGDDPARYAEDLVCRSGEPVIGYVCRGALVSGTPGSLERPSVVAVADHANLTWRSPLLGPNDERLGPRFPSMIGAYSPEMLESFYRSGVGMSGDHDSGGGKSGDGMIVAPGTVAGVVDDAHPTDFESEMARRQGYVAISSELVPVVIVAAHLGLRVAAALVIAGN